MCFPTVEAHSPALVTVQCLKTIVYIFCSAFTADITSGARYSIKARTRSYPSFLNAFTVFF